jgi:hypothetical protein
MVHGSIFMKGKNSTRAGIENIVREMVYLLCFGANFKMDATFSWKIKISYKIRIMIDDDKLKKVKDLNYYNYLITITRINRYTRFATSNLKTKNKRSKENLE